VVSIAYIDACVKPLLSGFLLESDVSDELLEGGKGVLGTLTAKSDV
jgi:hypothetical protein